VIEERGRREAFEGNCRAFALRTGAQPYAIFNRKNCLLLLQNARTSWTPDIR
jgi:hypothetical protein